jgi:hypothetical protein
MPVSLRNLIVFGVATFDLVEVYSIGAGQWGWINPP